MVLFKSPFSVKSVKENLPNWMPGKWKLEHNLYTTAPALAHGQRATDNSGSPVRAVNATMLGKQVDSQVPGVQKQKCKQKSGIQFPGKSVPSLCRLS